MSVDKHHPFIQKNLKFKRFEKGNMILFKTWKKTQLCHQQCWKIQTGGGATNANCKLQGKKSKKKSERPVDALAENGKSLTPSPTDTLESRDASASKKVKNLGEKSVKQSTCDWTCTVCEFLTKFPTSAKLSIDKVITLYFSFDF